MNVVINEVKSCFDGMVGFTQITDPCTQAETGFLPDSMTDTDSGLYFDTYCEDVNHEMMLAYSQDYKTNTWAQWDAGASYAAGAAVQEGDAVYKSLTSANVGNQPSISPANWTVVFSEAPSYQSWLQNEKAQALTTMMHEWSKKRGTKSPLTSTTMYTGAAYVGDTFIPTNNFRGIRINQVSHSGLILRITRFGLQLQQAQPAPVTIYIFHESSSTPVHTFTTNGSSTKDMNWVGGLNIVLPYQDATLNSQGGTWYIGYFEDEITAGNVIYKKNINLTATTSYYCAGCGPDPNRKNFAMYRPYLMLSAITVANSFLNGTDLFDLQGVREVGGTNNGINIEFSVECDNTYYVCQQRAAFAELWQMSFNIRMLKKIETNPNARVNQFADAKNAVRERVIFALYGDKETPGLEKKYKDKMDKLILDTEGMHSACLPTLADNNFSFTSVY